MKFFNVFVVAFLFFVGIIMGSGTVNAQWPWQIRQQQYNYRYNPPRVYYQPHVIWIPQGTSLNVNGVYVDPYRRNVTMGINYGFYNIPRVQTFNFYNGYTGQVIR